MCSQTTAPENVQEIYDYSKLLDENRDQLEGLPYDGAFNFMAGADRMPDERVGDERAVWQLIEDDDLSDYQLERAQEIVDQYPYDSLDEIIEQRNKQLLMAELFESPIRFDKYDVRFAKDLIGKIRDGNLISQEQVKYLKYFVYRYRDQLREQVIYEENGTEELYEMLGEDPRESLEALLSECEEAYQEVNPRR